MGSIHHITSSPVGHPSRFANERDMETFLVDHPALLAEHLSAGDDDGEVVFMLRQENLHHAFGEGTEGRLDLVFVLRDGDRYILYLAELKNDTAAKAAVVQLSSYLKAWKHDANQSLRGRVTAFLVADCGLSEDQATVVTNRISGVLVAPGFAFDAVNELVAWAAEHPETPIQALRLFRFRHAGGHGHLIFVDDHYVVPRSTLRRTIRWSELADALPGLVGEATVFALRCGGRVFTARPDFTEGRGKKLRLTEDLLEEALERAGDAVILHPWEPPRVDKAHASLRAGDSVPMSPLTLFLQRVFSRQKEPDWQTPASLWFMRDDPQERTIQQLDALLK